MRVRTAGFTFIELLGVMLIIGAVAAIAVPRIRGAQDKARIARAIGDIRALQADLASADTLPSTLAAIGRGTLTDPWGNVYQYNKFDQSKGVPQGARRDRFLVPINSEYDLYSKGENGQSVVSLTAKASQDDVIRANDGRFIGLAKLF